MIAAAVNLYKNAYTGLTRRIWLLAVVMFVNRCGTMVLPFMTLYCRNIGFTTKQAGWVVAIYGLGSVAGAFIGGKTSDKVGFYKTQVFTLISGGLLFLLLGQMKTYVSICVCTFFLSMVNEAFRPANSTAIAHYSNASNRTQSFSLVRFSINIAWGVGSALGGLLAAINYKLLFWVDGFTNIGAAVLLLLLLPKVSLKEQQREPAEKKETQMASSPYRDRVFLFFIFFHIVFSLCFFQLFTTVPMFFKEGLHLNESVIGVVMALNGVVIALVEMVIVFKLEGKKPYLIFASAGSVVMALSYFMLNLAVLDGLFVAILSTLTVTLAEMVTLPFMNSYYISRSNESNRGSYAALYTMGWSVAQVIGSSTGAVIAYSIGFENLWWIIGGLSLVASSGFRWIQSVQKIKGR
jgi:predicted MFS family arabinose efflux permease